MRGAVPVTLALGLPSALPHREELVTIVFGVVLFSLLIQGLSMPALIRCLKLGQDHDNQAGAELVSPHLPELSLK
jgi:monovalent cation:H+ antiporter, CPA1 family